MKLGDLTFFNVNLYPTFPMVEGYAFLYVDHNGQAGFTFYRYPPQWMKGYI